MRHRQDAIFRAKSDAAQKRIVTIPSDERRVLETNFLKAIGAHEPEPIKERAMADGGKTVGGTGKLAKIREKFPNAGRAWTKDDDEKLTEMFNADTTIKTICKEFGRKSGAINARLAKLGLIEDDYWARKSSQKTRT